MKNNIDISIIILSYNEQQYLEEAISSCLTIAPEITYEIIIGDDGSNDGSIDIINNYSKKYPDIIKYFIMDREISEPIIASLRASNVIKHALTISSGKYCYILSGDDYISDTSFFNQALDILKKNTSIDTVISNSYIKCYSNQTTEIYSVRNFFPKLYWSGNYIHISCFLFNKQIAINNLLDRFCDDTGLQYSLTYGNKWKWINKSFFCYRQQDKSIMHTSDELELSLIEIMLLQDCINKSNRKFEISTLSRFSKPLNYIFQNRKNLSSEKYKKYLQNCKKYKNDIINKIVNYNETSFFEKIFLKFYINYSIIFYILFKIIRKI